MTLVKICGVVRAEDAAAAVAAGADLIGVNFWPRSPRCATEEEARRVRQAVPAGVQLVGVFVDDDPDRIDDLVGSVGLDRVQLHGSESRVLVERYGARAIRGIRDGDLSVVPPGVTVVYDRPWGETRDIEALYAHWREASRLVADWPLLLAGRLDAENVAQAVREVRPYGVDVASGVESAAGIKDHELVRRFVAAAKEAA
ncbi:MAG TPA: phosphoribosylanthranilate isomerase [Gaiellales bacterium]|jgi:phosphoribosylanthranilate isomerase|nr:phosphoribosylanthranilate isomerase [Gaiellales bacterium]